MQFALEHRLEEDGVMKNLNVVIAGRERDTIEFLASLTQRALDCRPQLQHINNGHADPLHGHTETPDLLILDLAADWREQLGALTRASVESYWLGTGLTWRFGRGCCERLPCTE